MQKLVRRKRINKKANLLTENIIFIVLNLIFLIVLILFLFSKMGSSAVLEEKYAKQIALIIDSAKPGMIIELNMPDAVEEAKDNNWDFENVVLFEGNTVTVKLRENGGYSYAYFNDVQVISHSNVDRYGFIIQKNE